MSARYVVIPTPYGLTFDPDFNANWGVIDTQPVIEEYETKTGAVMTETKAPPLRSVAWCKKKSQADMVAKALNAPHVQTYARLSRHVDEEMLANAVRVASWVPGLPRGDK